ncbi:protein aurora borealis-like [Dermacentor variabilis]|uniref:protein aurora borealis-like n=1 Tax=Dermacentor variabilis TaxID=34621 RepID=UPI003F5B5934
MNDFKQSSVRGSTSSTDACTRGEDGGSSVNGPTSPLSRSSALAGVALLATPGDNASSNTNPFDVEPEQLTQPSCSPSMFLSRSRQTPGSRRSFRWSIEQMAGLWPVNIEEEEPSFPQTARSDALYEEQSQQAIELFFSRHEIVPSPWEAPSRMRSAFVASKGLLDGNNTLSGREPQSSSAWSQTTLSIPPDADLSSLLGEYFTFHAAQDKQTASQANNSRDSLRRKLFCNAVEGKVNYPESAKQSCQVAERQGLVKRESQRLSVLMDGPIRRQSSTPVHMALCSSPIGGGGLRARCSQGSSPEGEGMQLSPICRQARTKPLLGTPQQQRNLKIREPEESLPSTDEDDRSDHTDESVATSGGAGDMSVLTAGDRSDFMQLSPSSNGSRQREPL